MRPLVKSLSSDDAWAGHARTDGRTGRKLKSIYTADNRSDTDC